MPVRLYVAAAVSARGCIRVATAMRVLHSTMAMAGDAARDEALFAATGHVTAMQPFRSLYSAADLDDLAAHFGLIFVVSPAPLTVTAVEYHHVRFDHYFVTALDTEIARLDRGDFAGWSRTGGSFEGAVFQVVLPAFDGRCTEGSIPVYRLDNGGQRGAPNHRFTAALEVRAAMLARGWISEGRGDLGVAMCAAGP